MILLGHGSGGRMTDELIRSLFLPHIGSAALREGDDSAILGRLALTVDAFTVTPQDFPGGDIGGLAVSGTVNDLAMVGAAPAALAASFVLEEGVARADVERWAASMGRTAREAGVELVTCDTKVVGRGAADRIFITTAGLGEIPEGVEIRASGARQGDAVIISGTIADHGAAVLCTREGLGLEGEIVSDSAPLWGLVRGLLDADVEVHSLRDPTRGGLAQCLNEIARASGVRVEVREAEIPIRPPVRAACDLLGLDPLHVASEGKLVAFVAGDDAGTALAVLRRHPLGQRAVCIGRVVGGEGDVVLETTVGARRTVAMPSGEMLPRIC